MFRRLFLVTLLVLWTQGCRQQVQPAPTLEAYQQLPGLLILPLQGFQRDATTGAAVCPVCLQPYTGSAFSPEDGDRFSSVLHSEFEKSFRFRVLPGETSLRMHVPRDAWSEHPEHWTDTWREARDLGATYVLTIALFRFDERQGDAFAAVKPASVAFEVHLFETAGGRQLWSQHFDETQTSLSENVLTVKKVVKRRARWLTASELARDGVADVLAAMPPLG